MPSRSPWWDGQVWDAVAQVLLSQALSVPLPDLPDVIRAERA